MIERREKDWQELEQKAFQMLENPHLLPKNAILKFYEPILRFWTYPSFSPYQVWIFSRPNFRTIQPKNFKVIRAIWNRNEDFRCLSNRLEGLKRGFEIEPKVEVSSVEIEKEIFEEIYKKLNRIKFNPLRAKMFLALTEKYMELKLSIHYSKREFIGGMYIRKSEKNYLIGLTKQLSL